MSCPLSDDEIDQLAKDPLVLVVVGPTNVGKTSLIRTLTVQPGFGKVANKAGVTVDDQPVWIEFPDRKLVVMKIYDTPGFEDLDGAQAALGATPSVEEIRQYFSQNPKLATQLKVIEALRQSHVAFYVIETSLQPLTDHEEQLFLVQRLGVPVVPVFHRFADHVARRDDWRELLERNALQNDIVEIDARVFRPVHEVKLYSNAARRLPKESIHERFLNYYIERRKEHHEDRKAQAAEELLEFSKDLISLAVEEKDVNEDHVTVTQAKLQELLDKNESDRVNGIDKALKEFFGFRDNNSVHEDERNTHDSEQRTNVNTNLHTLGIKWKRDSRAGAVIGVVAGVTIDIVSGGTTMGLGTLSALAGMGVGTLVATGINVSYDRKSRVVRCCLTREEIFRQFKRSLSLIQRLYYSGAAAVTDGTINNGPAPIQLGPIQLSPELEKRLKQALVPRLPASRNNGIGLLFKSLAATPPDDLSLELVLEAVGEVLKCPPE